jgi:predicted HD superfamily hydrolase involved in NAD metabolism
MFNRSKIIEYLTKYQTGARLQHILSTEQCAIRLADLYNVDEEKAQIAALLHDCAKWMDNNSIMENALEYGLTLDDVYKNNPNLAHGWAGANIARKVFGIYDKEILDAICYHTIPSLVMSDLSKLIYVADYIEDTRNFDDARRIRGMLYKDLDEVFLITLSSIIKHQISAGKQLHVDSVHTYNNIISRNSNLK